MSSNLNYFYRADITVIGYFNGATQTTTYSFVNKFLKDSNSATTYWPILKSIGEISLTATDTLPNISLSAIEIDNRIGTFGANRKFSDVLQRYSPIEQTVILYVAEVTTASDAPSSWTQLAQGVVSDWEANSADGDGTLTFNIRPVKYPETVLNLEVARTVSGMSGAPLSSIGRPIPLLIGDNLDFPPVRITADGSTNPTYAVGTCFYQLLQNDLSAARVATRNELGGWTTLVSTSATDYSATVSAGSYTLNTFSNAAYLINPSSITDLLISGVRLRCKANGVALRVSKAILNVFILKVLESSRYVEQVAEGSVYLANYDASNNNTGVDFYINVSFKAPVLLEGSTYGYYIGFGCTGYEPNELSLHFHSGFTGAAYIKNSTSAATYDSPDEWRQATTGLNPLCYKLHGITFSFTDHVNAFTSAGLTYSSMTATQFTPDSGQTNPPLDNLPILITRVAGLVAYGGGAVLDRPTSLAPLLSYTWNGSAWVTGTAWDVTTLDSSHYAYLYGGVNANFRSRGVYGVFEQKITLSQFLAEMCRGSASRVGVLANGQSFMYPWGVTATPAKDIPFADIISLSWVQRDISTVINKCVLKMSKTYLYAPRSFESSDTTGYRYTTDFSAGNYPQVAAMTLVSRTLFGTKELANGDLTLWPISSGPAGSDGYMGDSSSVGSVLAEYYLSRFASPLVYCSFVVPYSRYNTLKMFDVITFTHPEFPAFYGTESNARDGTVNVAGAVTAVTAADYGYETVRAQTYRGLIEGISYVMAMEHAPAIRLTVQVLLNQEWDPT